MNISRFAKKKNRNFSSNKQIFRDLSQKYDYWFNESKK